MAELLIAQGWTPPDSIALRLREDVPANIFVVVGATVYGTEFDIIIVSNCGLIVLYRSEMRVDAFATAESIGQAPGFFQEAVQRSEHALDQFMQDEFPASHPVVRHLIVGVDVADQLADSGIIEVASVASEEQMVDAILTTFDPDCPQMLDQRQCSELAQADCERRLTVRQRASAPFVFRQETYRARQDSLDDPGGDTAYGSPSGRRHLSFAQRYFRPLATAARRGADGGNGKRRTELGRVLTARHIGNLLDRYGSGRSAIN